MLIPTEKIASEERNSNRDRFVNEYVASQVTRDNANLYDIAIKAGYSPRSAHVTASRLLNDPKIQSAIKAKMERLRAKTEWNLERSAREAEVEFSRLREIRPDTAYKYKENLDKLHGLLVEKRENTNTNRPETPRELKTASTEELILALSERLKLSSQGVKTDPVEADGRSESL